MKLLISLLGTVAIFAQSATPIFNSISLTTPPPPVPEGISATRVGNAGNGMFYYWVIAKYPGGNSNPSMPILVRNVPNTLTGSNFIRLNWNLQNGATGYDVLRTTTANIPNGNCSCAVATSTTATTVDDTGGVLGSYTLNSTSGASTTCYIDNLNVGTPAVSCSPIAWGGGGGGGTGDVVGPSSATNNAIVRYNSTTGKLIKNSTVTVDDSGNIVTTGAITTGSGGGAAGYVDFGQGTAPSVGTNSVTLYGGSAITSYIMRLPSAAATGFLLGTNTAGDVVQTFVPFTGTGDVVRSDSPVLITPQLGIPASGVATNLTGLPIDAGTVGTLPGTRGGTGLTTFSRSGNTTEYGTVLGTKTTGKQLAFDSSGNVIASTADIGGGGGGGSFNPSTTSTCIDEMNYSTIATTTGLGQCNLQFANVTTSAVADTDESGIVTLTTTASTSGIGSASSLNTSVLFGGAQYTLWSRIKLDVLSDATDTYTVTAGYSDSSAAVDGCYARYSHGINAGKWQGVCTANSVSTTLDLGVTVAIATWYKLQVIVNSAGTSAEFFINSVSSGTITTNIPVGAGRQTGMVTRIVKSAGTTPRLLNIGFIAQEVVYASAR